MRHPIQRLHTCPQTSRLYTGASNVLHVFDATTGKLLSTWAAPTTTTTTVNPSAVSTAAEEGADTNPKKKRKVAEISSSPQPEKKGKRGRGQNHGGAQIGGHAVNNAITKILTTADGKHAIVATNDDKAVTVFSTLDGKLEVLSVRHMPKRIVDLALAEHGNKILCADKFGDVFAIPLFPPASDSETIKPGSGTPALDSGMAGLDTTEKVYESEEQKQRHIERQKANIAREQAAAERRKRLQVDYNIPFSHDFVLGHVSMLLSLLTITLPAEHPQANGKEKTWVLTSDRDEHIRVTRFPQSFVIEGFCLGHTQFVKAMLAPSWNPTSLISGGGDEFLLVWDWKDRKIVQKVDLVEPVQAVLGPDAKIFVPKTGERGEAETAEQEEEGLYKFAVSGLWEVPSIHGILVGIEKVPALFLFTFSPEGLKFTSTLQLPGNFLDAAVLPAGNKVFASVDPADAAQPLLGVYALSKTGEWSSAAPDDGIARTVEQCVMEAVDLSEELVAAVTPHVLYPVGSLRKEYGIKDREEREE